MKSFTSIFFLLLVLFSCNSYKTVNTTNLDKDVPEEDLVRLKSDALEYEIIIIEPGFNSWLIKMAQPEGYYSQSYMETRNRMMVQEWNARVLQPTVYDPDLYQLRIDYEPGIDYGYDLNYKLYNYFIYFQLTYKQRLSSFVPRI